MGRLGLISQKVCGKRRREHFSRSFLSAVYPDTCQFGARSGDSSVHRRYSLGGQPKPMISRITNTFSRYARAARFFALEPGRTWLGSWAAILWFRIRHGMSPFYLALFTIDGKWPQNPSEYVQHQIDKVESFMHRMNPVAAYAAVDDKVEFYLRCRRRTLPTPRILTAVPPPGSISTRTGAEIPLSRTAEEFRANLTESGIEEFFCKPLDGINGKGGFGFTVRGFSGSKNSGASPAEQLFERVCEAASRYGSMIVQERVALHPHMRSISPSGALSTVRVVTSLEHGNEVRLVASILKICVGTNETDNFARGLKGNLIANIDPATGRLSAAIGSVNPDFPLLRSLQNHPDNNAKIAGFQLPDWDQLLSLVKVAHREFSEFWTLGWDIALTDKGPILIEANPVWATAFLQTASGKGMKHEFVRWQKQLSEREARTAEERSAHNPTVA
jgi:hypothetical protein